MRRFKKHGEKLDEEVIAGISQWYDIYCSERQRCSYRVIESSRGKKHPKRGNLEEETYEQQLPVKM
jgi:hypothetical protein